MTTLNSEETVNLLKEIILGLGGRPISESALAKIIADETALSAEQAGRVAGAILVYARMYHETELVEKNGGIIDIPHDFPFEP